MNIHTVTCQLLRSILIGDHGHIQEVFNMGSSLGDVIPTKGVKDL